MVRVHVLRCKRIRIARHTPRGTDLGKTKVQNLGVSSLGDEDVRRLDVPVNNSFGMGGIQGVGNLDSDSEQLFQFHRPSGDRVF